MIRSENLYVIGLANGTVKIAQSTGSIVAELSSHSRSLNALVCHPSKPLFATCSDDTFMNVFEVKGDKPERIDVNLVLSSKVNDYQLCGLVFAGEGNNSILSVPYDFKTLIVWSNVV